MSAEQATALVLRTYDFSESSLVVTLFTREFGKIRGIAKGAKRPKNPFDFALDLLSLCRVVFLRKSSEALHIITEAKLQRRFRVEQSGLPRYYAALYVAELLNAMTDEEDAHPELFDVSEETLTVLQKGGDIQLLVPFYELRILDLTGHSPALDMCVSCGESVRGRASAQSREEGHPTSGANARQEYYFSLLDGGVLCGRCRPGKRGVVLVPASVIDAMEELRGKTPRDVGSLHIAPSVSGQLRGLLGQYVCHLLGQRPRMHEYLGLSGR
ncbi:DNA recombination and repair protein RecO [Thermogutta terrifontis]|uniref:DNA repair protein RecO n=1 Tax=Thermogutta terrifontis TaxID=1331910 RepID=A0A286RB37_9BACT|nr:DNA repair protein RecO [Thermogutta terrifontis]ASV73157.1 DNA recombination and repair protein RecO [Thermogutta terrifontis]